MPKNLHALAVLACGALLLPLAGFAQDAPPRDWTTWGYDQERTAWNRGEATLGRDNVSKLKLVWNSQLSTPVSDVVLSTVTAPVVVEGVATAQGRKDLLFVLGADDTLFALDAGSGKILWQKTYANPIQPKITPDWLCPATANDTPVIDKVKGIVFFIPSDGKLRGVALDDGADKLTPVQTVAPFTRAWSLNLIDDVVYTTSGRACGEVLDTRSAMYAAGSSVRRGREAALTDPSAVTAVDVSDPAHPEVTHFYTSGARPAAPWGRGGLARGPNNSVILETSDGQYDPAGGDFSESILRLSPKAARLVDSFTPDNWRFILAHDLAGSANPTVFRFGGKTLVAAAQKEGVLRLLDADALGGEPHSHSTPLFQTPQLGNDAAAGTDPSSGIWGGVTTYETPDGKRFLYVPMWGPPSRNAPAFKTGGGGAPNGGIMAFQVMAEGGKFSLLPQWTSPDMVMPDPPVAANGVLYATSTGGQAFQNVHKPGEARFDHAYGAHFRATPVGNLILYAFDAQTGKQLYSSRKTIAGWVHFSEPVVALGKVFLVTHDAHVYAFGVKP